MNQSRNHYVLSWDWKEQPPLDQLANAIHQATNGQLHFIEIDTGSDQYAIVLSTEPLTAVEAYRLYDEDARCDECRQDAATPRCGVCGQPATPETFEPLTFSVIEIVPGVVRAVPDRAFRIDPHTGAVCTCQEPSNQEQP